MSTLTLRARTGLLLAGLLLIAAPLAHSEPFVGTFGVPFKRFDGRLIFKASNAATPTLTVNIRPTLDKGWSLGRDKLATLVKNEIAKRRFHGQGAYNINVVLSNNIDLEAMADGARLSIKAIFRGNSVTAKMTTPTIFGSYADPKFTVDFDVEVVFNMGRLPSGKIGVLSANVSLANAHVRGRNVTGTVGLAIADVVGLFGGPDLRRIAQDTINTQHFSQDLNVALAPVAFQGSMFASILPTGILNWVPDSVLIRFLPAGGPGPVVR